MDDQTEERIWERSVTKTKKDKGQGERVSHNRKNAGHLLQLWIEALATHNNCMYCVGLCLWDSVFTYLQVFKCSFIMYVESIRNKETKYYRKTKYVCK